VLYNRGRVSLSFVPKDFRIFRHAFRRNLFAWGLVGWGFFALLSLVLYPLFFVLFLSFVFCLLPFVHFLLSTRSVDLGVRDDESM